jgi:2-dehydro-3-deoxygalactonokinase
MICIDWGTSSFRAFRLDATGGVAEQRAAARGILGVPEDGFPAALTELVGDWIEAGEGRLLLSGMVGSRQGWREAPYVDAPAGLADLARALLPVSAGPGHGFIVPGLIARGLTGVPEIMRGEETQIMGVVEAMAGRALACLPGSHSKWAQVVDGRIVDFTTAMTGEAFAALQHHTILGRLMTEDSHDGAAFDEGLARSGDPGGLLHHVFGARTRVIVGDLAGGGARSYLSGILIGHDVRAALDLYGRDAIVHLIGEPGLCMLYARALAACGAGSRLASADAAIKGLARIGDLAPWH